MCADNNDTNTTSSTLHGDEQVVEKTWLLAGVLALSLLGIPTNLLSIFLILRAKQPKTTTTYFLLNLAIADIVNLLASLLRAILIYLSIRHGRNAIDDYSSIEGGCQHNTGVHRFGTLQRSGQDHGAFCEHGQGKSQNYFGCDMVSLYHPLYARVHFRPVEHRRDEHFSSHFLHM